MFQRSTIRRRIGIFLCWLLLMPFTVKAQSKEYQVKAAFLLNFTKFVEWQPPALPEGPDPFCIVILGDDPFGQTLDATIQGETVKGHKMVIHRVQKLSDVKECHLLFISKSEKGRVPAILTELKDRPFLTVSEVDDFAERGGHIGFFLEKTKIRFAINQTAAQSRGLKISSDLLSLGKIVRTEKEGK